MKTTFQFKNSNLFKLKQLASQFQKARRQAKCHLKVDLKSQSLSLLNLKKAKNSKKMKSKKEARKNE